MSVPIRATVKKGNTRANSFLKNFNPYRQKYTIRGNSFFGEDWHTVDNRLTAGLVEKAILGNLIVGYYSTYMPNSLSIDIDDHRGTAWTGTQASPYLLSLYSQIKHIFGYPSILAQSPRGLHLHYLLQEKIPADLLVSLSKEKLKKIPCEIKGTPNLSLRIPAESRLLNPETLELLQQDFDEVTETATFYHPAMLFNEDFLPENVKQGLKEKKTSLKRLRHAPRVARVEAENTPFIDGQSNEAYLKIVTAYKLASYDISEAFYRFQVILKQSPMYSGDLNNPERLYKKIKSSYKNLKTYEPKAKPLQYGLFDSLASDNIGELYRKYCCSNMYHHLTFRQRAGLTKQANSVKKLVNNILNWKNYIDEIKANPGDAALWDYLYKFFRKNTREGFYPLPFNLLRKFNKRYNELLPFLKKIGFIEDSGYRYNPGLNICKYYKINIEGFLNA